MKTLITLTLPGEIRYTRLASLTARQTAELFAESFDTAHKIAGFSHAFELSISEAFANAARYGESEKSPQQVIIHFSVEGSSLTASVSDTNPPFNPDDTKEPDIDSYPESGYGLLLIRKLMDRTIWSRENGINTITMSKKL